MSSTETPAPPAAAVSVLRAEHVTKMFGGLVAVNDVSFDIPQHSIVSRKPGLVISPARTKSICFASFVRPCLTRMSGML